MENLLKQIGSYNLFNYLFPGVVFAVISNQISCWEFLIGQTILDLFLCYFYGLIISRLGSIFVQKFFKKYFVEYHKFIKAEKKDSKITILSETNNTYRTIIALIVCCFILHIISLIVVSFPFIKIYLEYISPIFILVIFINSYQNQIEIIKTRVKENLNKES